MEGFPKLNVLAVGSEYMVLGEMFLLDAVEGSVWLVLGKPNPMLCLEMFHFRAQSKIKRFQTGPRMCLSSTALPSMCEGLGSIPYHRNK